MVPFWVETEIAIEIEIEPSNYTKVQMDSICDILYKWNEMPILLIMKSRQ